MASQEKAKQRWLQYSLRTFLLLVAVFSVWLGIQVSNARKQRAAVAAIERAGGLVVYDWMARRFDQLTDSGKQPHPLEIYFGESELKHPWLHSILGDDYFQKAVSVTFYATGKNPKDVVRDLPDWDGYPPEVRAFANRLPERTCFDASVLHQLRYLPALETLSLDRGLQVGDGDLEHIAKLTELVDLRLDCPLVGDAGIRHLTPLKKLKFLFLSETAVTDESASVLATFKNLVWITVGENVTLNGFHRLQKALPTCIVWSPKHGSNTAYAD